MRARLGRTVAASRRWLQRDRAVEPLMLGLGVATGFLTGVLAWALIALIDLVQWIAWSPQVPAWQLVVVPTVGALVVGLLLDRVPEASGGGVVVTMETIALRGGRFRRRVAWGGTLATGIALGTGASGGREGPIVLIGGAVGSLLSRLVPVGEDRTGSLVAAGAAAGIGASFNAPIGGMLFAIEVLLGGIRRARSLQVVVVASVVGSVTARQLVGDDLPLFRPPPGLGLGDPTELLLYGLLGLTAVAVALGFQHTDARARRLFTRLRARIGRPLSMAVAGLGVGVIALFVPEVLGDGADLPGIDGEQQPIQAIIDGAFGTGWSTVAVLLALLLAKLAATALSTGSGNAVGIFAPTLFLGAALGGAFGVVAFQLLGDASADAAGFALVGMAAVFAATARAPLTAILIVFELTGSYDLVLPLMLAVGIATFTAELGRTPSIYVQQLRERGVVYTSGDDLDVLQTVSVGEVMTVDHPTLAVDLPGETARQRLEATGSHGAAVVDADGRLVGVLTRRDLDRPGRTVGERCTRQVSTVAPGDPVFVGVRRMASLEVGRLPVIDPATRQVLGMLRRGDVVRAYQRGIHRSLGTQQRAAASRLRDLSGVRFVEVAIDGGAALVGRQVKDVAWPTRTVVASIRRAGAVIVPDGDTTLQAGDELVVLTATPDEVRALVLPEPTA